MLKDFNLTKLPSYGKVFVGLFACLMLGVVLWAGSLAIIESGIFGEVDTAGQSQQEYDYKADLETIMGDSKAVTAPNWADSGQEEPIDSDDYDDFAAQETEETGWPKFISNLKLSHLHLNGHTALYFALGLVFLFTTVPDKRKKQIYWIFGIAIILHTLGLLGLDYCIYAKILTIIGGVPLLLSILYMVLKIFGDLRRRAE
jgi:hypothetical protein